MRGRIVLLGILALGAGVLASEALHQSAAGRDALERVVRLARDSKVENSERSVLANLRGNSKEEPVSNEAIERELNLLRAQFAQENVYARVLESSGLLATSLREEIAEHLRARSWIENQLAPEMNIAPAEVQQFYSAHRERFVQAQRYRASHIFLASPDGTPAETAATQQSAIQGLSVRILAGEKFAELAEEASEDEATKSSGGDLGYFSAARVPPEIIAELEKLRVGEISAPIRSHLGWHILQLTDSKPAHEMSFEEVRAEVGLVLANEKRTDGVTRLQERLKAR